MTEAQLIHDGWRLWQDRADNINDLVAVHITPEMLQAARRAIPERKAHIKLYALTHANNGCAVG